MWVWVGLMNPHRLTWELKYQFPIAMMVGIPTLVGFVFHSDKGRFPNERETWMLVLLGLLFTITSFFAIFPKEAWGEWERIGKILLMTFIALFLFQDKKKLRYLFLTIGLSIGFFGVKGGLWGIVSGGQHIVFGPQYSFIEDNNALALAELMVLPLLVYLGREESRRLVRNSLFAIAGLTFISIILSYSRGALLGLVALSFYFLAKSKKKVAYLFLAGFVLFGILIFAPSKWFDRMNTIGNYQEDASAMGRINAWWFAYNVAVDRPLVGGGFGVFSWELFQKYAPNPGDVHDAHSIYFEVLGEHGFVGLGVFVSLLICCYRSMGKVLRLCRGIESLQWAENYSQMLQLSIFAYSVSGAFLGLAYFDLFYYIVAGVILVKMEVRKELEDINLKMGSSETIPRGITSLPPSKGRKDPWGVTAR